jgi:hypothetical protein
VLKEVSKNVEKVKAKSNEPSPLEFDDDKVFQFFKYEKLGNKWHPYQRLIMYEITTQPSFMTFGLTCAIPKPTFPLHNSSKWLLTLGRNFKKELQ